MYHHFNGGTLSHGSLTSGYIAITSFLRVTGCPLFAAVSAQNVQSQTDQQSHINAEHFSLAGISLSGSTWSCIFNFQGPPGCGSRSLSEVGRCRDNSVSYFRAKVYGLVVQVTHPLSPYIVYNSPKKQKKSRLKSKTFALPSDGMSFDTTVINSKKLLTWSQL